MKFNLKYVKKDDCKRGFTLIETLVVIAIIAVLATAGAAMYGTAMKKARDNTRDIDIEAIKQALMMYKADIGMYPHTGTWEADINNYIEEGTPQDPNGTSYLYTGGGVCIACPATPCGCPSYTIVATEREL